MATVRIWSYAEDVTEVDASPRYNLEQQVHDYVMRNYDADWSDHVQLFAQGPYEKEPRKFSVFIENTIRVTVKGEA